MPVLILQPVAVGLLANRAVDRYGRTSTSSVENTSASVSYLSVSSGSRTVNIYVQDICVTPEDEVNFQDILVFRLVRNALFVWNHKVHRHFKKSRHWDLS
jgi:hypothetical protein